MRCQAAFDGFSFISPRGGSFLRRILTLEMIMRLLCKPVERYNALSGILHQLRKKL